MRLIRDLKDKIQGKLPKSAKRSGSWSRVRASFLTKNPECAACGSKKKLEVHHVVPFFLAPERELDETNLIVLCEAKTNGVTCHLFFGHLGSYRSYNIDVREDAASWRKRFEDRPATSNLEKSLVSRK